MKVVLLNTHRTRSRVDGRVYAFLGQRGAAGEPRRALAMSLASARRVTYHGLPIPAFVARLAGWTLYDQGR